MRRIFAAIAVAPLLASTTGCKSPYEGIDETAYGQLTVYRQQNQISDVPYCDSLGADSAALGTDIVYLLTKPFNDIFPVDPKLKEEGLVNEFRVPSDPMGGPTVVILRRNQRHISFWYIADSVQLAEVINAAIKYCKNAANTEAYYTGSSRQCSEPKQMGVSINGRSTVTLTYAISAFECGDGSNGAVAATAAPSSTPTKNPAVVKDIQLQLRRLGLLAGAADGVFGTKTSAAIKEFQKRAGLPINGLPSDALLDRLIKTY